MKEMDTWVTKMGVLMRNLCLLEKNGLEWAKDGSANLGPFRVDQATLNQAQMGLNFLG